MTCAANATLLLHFKSSVGGSVGAESDTVTLTITADAEKDITMSLTKDEYLHSLDSMNFPKDKFNIVERR